MATLSVRGLVRRFGPDVIAVDDVSFEVGDGRVAALLGPSGCGKTTVLRLIAGLDPLDAGDVLLDAESIVERPAHQRGLGLMFQGLALFPHMNVRDNVAFGLRMARWPRERRELRVVELLELVGLSGLAERRVDELSGGEQQRVGLARTLAPEPAVLLLDEPLGALDEGRKRALRQELRALLRRLRTTALIVSHDLRDAQALADDLIVMDEGRIPQAGALGDVIGNPASAEVADMLGYVVLIEGVVRDACAHEDGVGAVALPRIEGDGARAGAVRVMAHPSTLLGVPPGRGLGSGVRGEVVASYPDGPLQMLELRLGRLASPHARQVAVRWEWGLEPPAVGSEVDVAARPQTLRVFALRETSPA